MAKHVLALIAAMAMLTPGVCMCGCPCEMLLAGDSEPADAGQPPAPSCCHPAAPSDGPIATAPQDCCCDAQRPQAAEETPTNVASTDARGPHLVVAASTADPFVLVVEALTGPDPPGATRGPDSTSLHAVLRN